MKFFNWIKHNGFLIGILVLASIIRFYHLDYQSVWIDEIHTLNEANPAFSLSELYSAVLSSDPHPPLYFIFMHYVFLIFGYTTFVLRAFSAIVGIASVLGIYYLGKEVFNKKAGVYAAILLTINYFHLTYSQEGRMYALLFLATVLSFYFLVKMIKNLTLKSAVIYTLFSVLMIYCHFFALFTLVSQYLILFFFILRPYKATGKKMLGYCMATGFATLLLYLPTYSIFKKGAERSSIWIDMPTMDVYTQIFKDFFGQSEIVLFFIIILILTFFLHLFKEKGSETFYVDPDKDKLTFAFLILFTWIGITLLLPLIRSYTALPMLINRYFISIIPAILIVVSIGLYYIRNQVVRYLILGVIVVFSFTDIILVKKYYNTITKTQFREVSNYLINNNNNNDPVVSNLGWYFPYFLNNTNVKTTIVDKPLVALVNEMMSDSIEKFPFWYIDAHSRALEVPENIKTYLDKNFIITDSKEFYYCRTNHYSFIPDKLTETKFTEFNVIDKQHGDPFKYYIDVFETIDSSLVKASGWAWFENQDAVNTEIKLILVKDGKTFEVPFQKEIRKDVADYYKVPYNLDNCGFMFKILINKIQVGNYQLGIVLKNKKTKKEGFILTANSFTKN
jgi:hypothetical protein